MIRLNDAAKDYLKKLEWSDVVLGVEEYTS